MTTNLPSQCQVLLNMTLQGGAYKTLLRPPVPGDLGPMSPFLQINLLGLTSLIQLLRGANNSLLTSLLTLTTRDPLTVLHGITTMKECGMNREIQGGTVSETLHGTTNQTPTGIISLMPLGITSMSSPPGVAVRGNHPFACSDHPTSGDHSLPISSIHNSTSLLTPTTSTASHHDSCRKIFPLDIRLRDPRTLIVLTTLKEIFLLRWDLLITILATDCLILGSTNIPHGVDRSTQTLGLPLMASMASLLTCEGRGLLT